MLVADLEALSALGDYLQMVQDGVECLAKISIRGDVGRDPCSDVGLGGGMGLVMPTLELLDNQIAAHVSHHIAQGQRHG